MKSLPIWFVALLLATPAFAAKKPYMRCTQEQGAGVIVEIRIDLESSKRDGASQDVELSVQARHSSGEVRNFGNSSGWLKDDGEFNFSFCSRGHCPSSLSGKITRAGNVRN